MNVDAAMSLLEHGQHAPDTVIKRVVLTKDQLATYGLRKPRVPKDRKVGDTHFTVWCLAVGEASAPMKNHFYGFLLKDAIKKAVAWKEQPFQKAG